MTDNPGSYRGTSQASRCKSLRYDTWLMRSWSSSSTGRIRGGERYSAASGSSCAADETSCIVAMKQRVMKMAAQVAKQARTVKTMTVLHAHLMDEDWEPARRRSILACSRQRTGTSPTRTSAVSTISWITARGCQSAQTGFAMTPTRTSRRRSGPQGRRPRTD